MKLLTLLGIFCLAQVSEAQTTCSGLYSPYNIITSLNDFTTYLCNDDNSFVSGFDDSADTWNGISIKRDSDGKGLISGTPSVAGTHIFNLFVNGTISSGNITVTVYDFCYRSTSGGNCISNQVMTPGSSITLSLYKAPTTPVINLQGQAPVYGDDGNDIPGRFPECSSSNATNVFSGFNGFTISIDTTSCALTVTAPTYTSMVILGIGVPYSLFDKLTAITFSTTGVVNSGGGGALLLIALFAFGINRLS